MVLSMTGFGRSSIEYLGKKISIDIKSLNSKNFDLNIRIPSKYKEKELEYRKLISNKLVRGKVDCYISIESSNEITSNKINPSVISIYTQDLLKLSDSLSEKEAIQIAMTLPDVLASEINEVEDNEWKIVSKLLEEALNQLTDFRVTEGKSLFVELKSNIQKIEENMNLITNFESERIQIVKEKFTQNLKELNLELNETRIQQELVFYVEKLDISEEKVRLSQHLKYFMETLNENESTGKKLGFITQEIGREINTIGSKANHHEIQKLVVDMKDYLERIREQIFNIL